MVFVEEHTEEYSESLASRLPHIQGLHYGILCTLERIVDIFRILRTKVKEELINKGYVRMMIALTQADKVFGSVVLNGRDLQHIPDYKNLEVSDTKKNIRKNILQMTLPKQIYHSYIITQYPARKLMYSHLLLPYFKPECPDIIKSG